MSGSAGNLVASHNQFGPYFRARTIPTDPATSLQLSMRAVMTFLSTTLWGRLTPAGRAEWDVYAANTPLPGRTGRRNLLTGRQHFLRTNLARRINLVPQQRTAPTIFALPSFRIPAFVGSATGVIVFVIDTGDPWVTEDRAALFVYLSPRRPSTVNFHAGPYRRVAAVFGSSASPPIAVQARVWPWARPPDPDHYFARVRVTRADGRLSQSRYAESV